MSIFREPPFEFDFTSASASYRHDEPLPHDGNKVWPGVDFRVQEHSMQLWIEVKSWSFKAILKKAERHKASRDWRQKVASDSLRDAIVAKFVGTTAYLHWSGIGPPARVHYIVLLEPPDRASRPLLGPFRDRLRNEFKNATSSPWGRSISYEVVDLDAFQAKYPGYPVRWL